MKTNIFGNHLEVDFYEEKQNVKKDRDKKVGARMRIKNSGVSLIERDRIVMLDIIIITLLAGI